MKYPHIDVEPLFTEMVREYPMGSVLTDKIPQPQFLNADFIFHHEKVVAELKRVTSDSIYNRNVQIKINTIVDKFYNEGRITTKDINESNWPTLPKELTEAIYDVSTQPIETHVKKANKQIKETKDRLGLSHYKGALIIVNDGVVSFNPPAFAYAVFRLLNKNFSGISFFLFFTANVQAVTREFPMPMNYWLGFDMEREGKMEVELFNNLHKLWKGLLHRKLGVPSHSADMKDAEGFWKAKNLPS